MRAATPATILVLVAAILLVFVTCTTPVIKSISFLEATIGGSGNQSGQKARLGCLGYCIGDTCKGPTLGYSFDPTQLLGVATSVQGFNVDSSKYSTAVIRGLTYALVLNPIALAACVLAFLTGLLGHCGDCVMVCVNSVMAGIASGLALIAVAINFALFILAQRRINNIEGASASLGTALWLSLAAWILIVLSSCTFCCGCGGSDRRRSRKSLRDESADDAWKQPNGGFGGPTGRNNNNYGEQMRMDALHAESDRKRRQNDLPKFATFETEHVEALPLKHDYDESLAHGSHSRHGNSFGGGAGRANDGYGYAYGDEGAYGHQDGASYIAGVGQGTRRNGPQPAVDAYYDTAPNSMNNLAGHGAHQATTPATLDPQHDAYGTAMGTPMNGMNGERDYFYPADAAAAPRAAKEEIEHDAYGGYATNDYSAPSEYPGQAQPESQYPGQQNASQYPGQASSYPYENQATSYHAHDPTAEEARRYDASVYGGADQHQQGYSQGHNVEPSLAAHGGGHPFDYSGATFGGGGAAMNQVGRSTSNASNTPYDAVQQATAAGRARRLPTVPTSPLPQEEIVYAAPSLHQHGGRGTSFGVGSIPPPRAKTGDDGFGVAILQAGAAAAAHSGDGGKGSANYYNDGYGGQTDRAPHRQATHDSQQGYYYTDHRTNSPTHFDEPPQYSASHQNQYGSSVQRQQSSGRYGR